MTDTRESASFFGRLKKVLTWLSSQLYFLRFPLLTAVAMVGLPYLGLRTDLKSLLASLFVSDPRGIELVSAVAFTTAWAILVTWRLIALYGDERFSRETVEKLIDAHGRTNMGRLLNGKDLQAVTAARLSASFPYVSPAARSDLDDPPSAKAHVVDGGYYDNYGITSLVEWLDYALDKKLLDEVLEMVGQFLNGVAKTENRAAEDSPLYPGVRKCKCD